MTSAQGCSDAEDVPPEPVNLAWDVAEFATSANRIIALGGGAEVETDEFDVAALLTEPAGADVRTHRHEDTLIAAQATPSASDPTGSSGTGSQVPLPEVVSFMGGTLQ